MYVYLEESTTKTSATNFYLDMHRIMLEVMYIFSHRYFGVVCV